MLPAICDFRASNAFIQEDYPINFRPFKVFIPRLWENGCLQLHSADYSLTKPERVNKNTVDVSPSMGPFTIHFSNMLWVLMGETKRSDKNGKTLACDGQ
ncbi:conserved hypothetical protein [delta proteobacterium NaphS2]|nr:conserved hypothetical protein [delta proteobacterium NaphS2]